MRLQRWWMGLVSVALMACCGGLGGRAWAQVATTQVADTVYLANGSAAQGQIVINWSAFETANGQAVPAGTTTVTLTSGGGVSVNLAPNVGAMPAGTYYTVIYHLSDGEVTRAYWVVPVSSTPVKIAAVQSTVLPSSVALQTVTKSYVDQAIAAAVQPLADGAEPYVLITGSTMTGPLYLSGDPTSTTQAATKNYVDENVSGLESGLTQKVSTLPTGTQTVVQPAGTSLGVNTLNGELYASQYQGIYGNNGIAAAAASSNCTSGCGIVAEPTYGSIGSEESWGGSSLNGTQGTGWASQTYLRDLRGGAETEVHNDAHNVLRSGDEYGHNIVDTHTLSAAQLAAAYGSSTVQYSGENILEQGLAGGSNIYPAGQNVPYFKSTYSALSMTGVYSAQGQHVLDSQLETCYGVGDCLIGSRYIYTAEGARDNSDEGAHPYDIQVNEDTVVPSGVCSAGCTTGSTQISMGSLTNTHLGEGRFVMDKNPADVINTGTLVGGTGQTYPFSQANFNGTSFPVSTFFLATGGVQPQAHNIAPGTVTIAIATTGLPSGYSSNTAAAPATSGVACIADTLPAGVAFASNFETVNYTVVDSTHITITFNKPHLYAPTVAIGGLCGYGLEQTVDSVAGSGGTIRQVVPVVGSFSAQGLYYAANNTLNTIGINGTGRYMNFSAAITSISRTSNVVTVTLSTPLTQDLSGSTVTISGVADTSYNGSYAITTTSSTSFTYNNTGANSTSSGGTMGLLTGGYNLYPMAEALSVLNHSTSAVDGGNLQLAPNTVAWASGDAIEMPHFHLGRNEGDTLYINQVEPRENYGQHRGHQITLSGTVGPDMIGMWVTNSMAASSYFGNGGTLSAPQTAYESSGAWQTVLTAQAGESNLFKVTCNSHGCGKWNSNYNLFALLNSGNSYDTINYNPVNSNLTFYIGGGQYSFASGVLTVPGFKANSLTVGTGATVTTSSGTGTQFVTTTTATRVSGDCVKWDASGNAIDAGAACGTGSGSSITTQTNGTSNSSQAVLNILSQSNGNITATNTSSGNVQLAMASDPVVTRTQSFVVATAQNGNAQPAGCSVYSSNTPTFAVVGDGSNSNVLAAAVLTPGAGSAQVISCPMVVPSSFGGTLTVSFNVSDTVASDAVTMYAKAVCTYAPANPAFGTAVSVSPSMSATAGTVVTSSGVSVTPGGTCTAGEPMYLEVYRSTSDGGTGNAYLYNVQAQYTGAL